MSNATERKVDLAKSLVRQADQAYESGEFAKALDLYGQAAEQGDPYYLIVVARMLIDGNGTPVDLPKAEALLKQAKVLGVREAPLQEAALHYAQGDKTGYFKSVREAEQLGSLPAKYLLGRCYARGIGVVQNMEEALRIMQSAADAGQLYAKAFVGKRLMRNPLDLFNFTRGVLIFLSSMSKALYVALKNPHDERIR